MSLITLRAMEPSDVGAMLRWENDRSLWHLGSTSEPFSREAITQFIQQSGEDIFSKKQLRLIIDLQGVAIGAIDLFDFDPINRHAGVGILVYQEALRGKGYAKQALEELIIYAAGRLGMHSLWAHVAVDNHASMALFEGCHFTSSGTLRSWIRLDSGVYQDVIVYQLCF